jgi:hypothetical protein
MKKQDCVVGMEVIASTRFTNYDSELVAWYSDGEEVQGEITDAQKNSGNNIVSVEWNKAAQTYRLDSETNADLLSPLSIKPELEAKFEELEKQIKFKCEQAALLIKEAEKMATLGGAPSLADMRDSGSLYNAMDCAGWQMSSIGC